MKNLSEDTIFNQALIKQEEKNIKSAFELYKKVLEINPSHLEALSNIGNILHSIKNYKDAINCFKKVNEKDPTNQYALNKLGLIYFDLGFNLKALEYFYKLKEINSNYPFLRYNLICILRSKKTLDLKIKNYELVKKLLIFLFENNDVHHDSISKNATYFITDQEISKINLENDNSIFFKENIKIILNEKLFHLILQKSLVTEIFLEKILIKLRHKFLLSVFDNSKINLENYKKFIISLAEQCWLNEFIWSQTKNEDDLIEKLKSRLYKKKYLNELEIAVLGCYIPLSNIKDLVRLENKISKDSLFNDLIKMQVLDFKKESKLKKSIKLLGNIDNTLSKKVRKQYEESPYPRWRYFNQLISVVDFKTDFNAQIYPNKIDLDKEFDSPNILLAGCGTGQHLMALTRYKGAKILAIDLSLSSIAYAKRKVEELNLKNIEFLQVDILELGKLKNKFDIIESAGTLHHMKDPKKGLENLLRLLKKNGLLRLGLYSKLARGEIIKFRNNLKTSNLSDKLDNIKKLREQFIQNDENDLKTRIILNKDFYSTSNLRDLLFHVHEYQFTIPEIIELTNLYDLDFLGFVFANKSIKHNYLKFFKNDVKNINLENWNKFEIDNPNIFISMYQFWVKKK